MPSMKKVTTSYIAAQHIGWLFAILFVSTVAFGQIGEPVEYLGIEHGLSNNAVTCIYQDQYGFMWFGTRDGLNKYDGYTFTVFKNHLHDSTSLIDNRIVAISEDADNNLWIGTKKGVSIFNNPDGHCTAVDYMPYGLHNHIKITSS